MEDTNDTEQSRMVAPRPSQPRSTILDDTEDKFEDKSSSARDLLWTKRFRGTRRNVISPTPVRYSPVLLESRQITAQHRRHNSMPAVQPLIALNEPAEDEQMYSDAEEELKGIAHRLSYKKRKGMRGSKLKIQRTGKVLGASEQIDEEAEVDRYVNMYNDNVVARAISPSKDRNDFLPRKQPRPEHEDSPGAAKSKSKRRAKEQPLPSPHLIHRFKSYSDDGHEEVAEWSDDNSESKNGFSSTNLSEAEEQLEDQGDYNYEVDEEEEEEEEEDEDTDGYLPELPTPPSRAQNPVIRDKQFGSATRGKPSLPPVFEVDSDCFSPSTTPDSSSFLTPSTYHPPYSINSSNNSKNNKKSLKKSSEGICIDKKKRADTSSLAPSPYSRTASVSGILITRSYSEPVLPEVRV